MQVERELVGRAHQIAAALIAIGLAIGAVTFIAMIVPARRALTVDPAAVLKSD